MRRPSITKFLVLWCLFLQLTALSQQPAIAPAPGWAKQTRYDYSISPGEADAEDGYFDYAFERQVSVGRRSNYLRKVVRIITEAGIENASEVSVDFYPSYQKLIFHTINVIREGKVIPKLKGSRFRVIHNEDERSLHLYSDKRTALLILDDIRKGDYIDYSYTLVGENPVFGGKFSLSFVSQYTVPIAHLYLAVTVPSGRSLQIKNIGNTREPVITKNAEATSYEWQWDQVKPLRLQENLPGWFEAYSRVMISEYKDWKEVNDWAMALFKPVSPRGELNEKIGQIRTTCTSPESRALAAIRYVQDEIRYTGLEMGVNSHQPTDPATVCQRRYGDCKDKSYLLCTMLGALGIEAYPVMINTENQKGIRDWLPTSHAFDHVTVQVKIGDQVSWIDPTINYQRGPLDKRYYPEYQAGLVVAPSTTQLTDIVPAKNSQLKAKEEFDIPDMSGNARLTVTTLHYGKYADNIRSSISNTSRYELLKGFTDFYKKSYEDIAIDTFYYKDNEETGMLSTVEVYSIKNIWEEEKGIKRASFNPYLIDPVILRPEQEKRTMPYALMYPSHYSEEVIINLPERWNLKLPGDLASSDSYRLKGTYEHSDKMIRLHYEYETLKDFIAPEHMDQYREAVGKEEKFGIRLSWSANGLPADDSGSDAGSRPERLTKSTGPSERKIFLWVTVLAVLVSVGLAVWRNRRQRG